MAVERAYVEDMLHLMGCVQGSFCQCLTVQDYNRRQGRLGSHHGIVQVYRATLTECGACSLLLSETSFHEDIDLRFPELICLEGAYVIALSLGHSVCTPGAWHLLHTPIQRGARMSL
jgi:hypothetical protein